MVASLTGSCFLCFESFNGCLWGGGCH